MLNESNIKLKYTGIISDFFQALTKEKIKKVRYDLIDPNILK